MNVCCICFFCFFFSWTWWCASRFFILLSLCFRYDTTLNCNIRNTISEQQMCIHYTYFIGIEKKYTFKWNRKEKLNSKQHNKILLLKWHRRRHRSRQHSPLYQKSIWTKMYSVCFVWWVSFEKEGKRWCALFAILTECATAFFDMNGWKLCKIGNLVIGRMKTCY